MGNGRYSYEIEKVPLPEGVRVRIRIKDEGGRVASTTEIDLQVDGTMEKFIQEEILRRFGRTAMKVAKEKAEEMGRKSRS